jgi:hypothetical protein
MAMVGTVVVKIKKRLAFFFHKARYFGFQIALWDLLDSQKQRLGIFCTVIGETKHAVIIKRLSTEFQSLIAGFAGQCAGTAPPEGPVPALIWICWWDGIDAMPPLVRACFNSVKKNAGSYRLTLITKDNYRDFISIPDFVVQKLDAGLISITHFSDIIRAALLAGHGGIWLDATMLVTDSIPSEPGPFCTIKKEYGADDVPKQRWTGFCMGGTKQNMLFVFMERFFFEYWKKYDNLIDYYLIDYVIAVAYNSIPEIRRMIDAVRLNNPDLYEIQDNFGKEASAERFAAICKNTMFHKLTWKKSYPMATVNGKPTFYGHIITQYAE